MPLLPPNQQRQSTEGTTCCYKDLLKRHTQLQHNTREVTIQIRQEKSHDEDEEADEMRPGP